MEYSKPVFVLLVVVVSYISTCQAIIGASSFSGQPELVIRIYDAANNGTMCYGVAIDSTMVLTVSNCEGISLLNTTISSGCDETRTVKRIVPIGNRDDIIGLKLSTPFTNSSCFTNVASEEFDNGLDLPTRCRMYSYGPTSLENVDKSITLNNVSSSIKVKIENTQRCSSKYSGDFQFSSTDLCVKLPRDTGLCMEYDIGAPVICDNDNGEHVLVGFFNGKGMYRDIRNCLSRYYGMPRVNSLDEYAIASYKKTIGEPRIFKEDCIPNAICGKQGVCICRCPGDVTKCTLNCQVDFSGCQWRENGTMFNIWKLREATDFAFRFGCGSTYSDYTGTRGFPDGSTYMFMEASNTYEGDEHWLGTTFEVETDMCMSFYYSSWSARPYNQGPFYLMLSTTNKTWVKDLNTTMYGEKDQWQFFNQRIPSQFIGEVTTFRFIMIDGYNYESDHCLNKIFFHYIATNGTCAGNTGN